MGHHNKHVGEFRKISFNDFANAINTSNLWLDMRSIKSAYNSIILPRRTNICSIGYTFYSPISFVLNPEESIKIPTGIYVRCDNRWFLMCIPIVPNREDYFQLNMNNVTIVTDQYYWSEEQGHIYTQVTNSGKKTISIHSGDKIMQGIFMQFGIVDEDKLTK